MPAYYKEINGACKDVCWVYPRIIYAYYANVFPSGAPRGSAWRSGRTKAYKPLARFVHHVQ